VRSKRDFTEQNQVVPGRDSPAPASWAGSHSREAKLHRQLGDAVRGAHENPRFVELGLAAQMSAIDAEALAIDERLVAAAGLPEPHREQALDALEANVHQLEATIADVITSVTVADSREQLQSAVSAADLKLQALAQARAEVEQIDRQVAGTDAVAEEVARQTQPPPPSASPHPAPPPPPPPAPPPPEPGTASG
jgi:D-ribose pyranose/furanose isomerase RbsD